MASGDTLLQFMPAASVAPSNYATFDTRGSHLVLDFDAATDEAVNFTAVMPRNYSGGGVTVRITWAASTATGGICRWQTAFESLDTQDIDSDGFATANSNGDTTNATSGQQTTTSIAHTAGAQMDSVIAGTPFRLKVNRDADGTTGTDSMTGDAELLMVEIIET